MKTLKEIVEGISGYDWQESDGCWDLLYNIFNEFNENSMKMLNNWIHTHENDTTSSFDSLNAIMYIIDILIKLDRKWLVKDWMSLLNECVQRCQSDVEWINNWNNPEEYKKAFEKKLKRIEEYKKIVEKENAR